MRTSDPVESYHLISQEDFESHYSVFSIGFPSAKRGFDQGRARHNARGAVEN